MGAFVHQVRENKIKAPNTREWTEEQWAKDFSDTSEPSDEDNVLFEAGLWFGKKLQYYWSEIKKLNLAQYDRFELHSKFTISFNFMTSTQISAVADPREFSADHALTAFGDTLNRVLQYLGSIHEFGRHSIDDESLGRCLNLFNAIYVHEFMWGRVLWSGWILVSSASGATLAPTSADEWDMIDHEAVAEFLRQTEAQQMQMIYAAEWDKGHHRDVSPPVIRLLKYQAPRAAFAVEPRPPATMPAYLPYLLSSLPEWLAPMLTRSTNELDGHGLIEIVNAWRLVTDVVRAIQDTDEVGLIHIDDAKALISAVRPHVSRPSARKIMEFLAYDPSEKRGDGIWAAPFVRLTEEVLCPVMPSLMHPNIQRMTDLWGERCRSQQLLTFRGGLWEQHLRDSLIEGFRGADWDVDWWVQSDDLKRWGHQIDVLFRVGRLVVVGETKFAKYPCIPAEFGRFFKETLDYGATQATLRQQALERNRKELAKLCKFKGNLDNLHVLPIVVSPHFLGSGLVLRGVNCVSYDDLLHFFVNDRLPVGAVSGKGGDAVAKLIFRKDGEAVDTALLRYLRQPPQTFLYSQAVERIQRGYVDPLAPDQSITWVEGAVCLPSDPKAFTVFARQAEAKWEAEVLGRESAPG